MPENNSAPITMNDISQQIIDIIESNKTVPQIAAFAQAIKPALVRYSGNDVMKMNEKMVTMINSINHFQSGTEVPPEQPEEEKKAAKDFVFKPSDFRSPQAVQSIAPAVERVISDDGLSNSEREDQIKKDAPILKMYREGFQKAKEISLKDFIELTQTMGMVYDENKKPVSINGAWKLFEVWARIKLGL